MLVTLIVSMFRIYDKFLIGAMRREMNNTKIRRFFVIFTLSFVYLTIIQIISATQDWEITGDPLDYPILVQLADFSIEIFYDIICIWLLVSVHHRHFKHMLKKRNRLDSLSKTQSSEQEHISIYEDDATSLKSGTIKHTLVPDENNDLREDLSEHHASVVGTALLAALAGNLDFTHETRARHHSGKLI